MSKNLTFEQWIRAAAGTQEDRNEAVDTHIDTMLESEETED